MDGGGHKIWTNNKNATVVALPLRVSKLACIMLFASPPHLLPREPAYYFATAGHVKRCEAVLALWSVGGVNAERSALSYNHTYQLLHTSDLRDLSVRREESLRLVMSTLCHRPGMRMHELIGGSGKRRVQNSYVISATAQT